MSLISDLIYGATNSSINHSNFDQGLPAVVRTSVCGTNSKAHDKELARRKHILAAGYFSKKFGYDFYGKFAESRTGIPQPDPVGYEFAKKAPQPVSVPAVLLAAAAVPIDIYDPAFKNRKSILSLLDNADD